MLQKKNKIFGTKKHVNSWVGFYLLLLAPSIPLTRCLWHVFRRLRPIREFQTLSGLAGRLAKRFLSLLAQPACLLASSSCVNLHRTFFVFARSSKRQMGCSLNEISGFFRLLLDGVRLMKEKLDGCCSRISLQRKAPERKRTKGKTRKKNFVQG